MCLVLVAYKVHPRYPIILAANRDEFYSRPSAAAAYWEETPGLFAGRDLVHRGTWLGITRGGRFAALTNYREPQAARQDAPSRGGLVSGFLQSDAGAQDYLAHLQGGATAYNGFNLLLGDPGELYCYSNKSGQTIRLSPGMHGLSNHLLDTPWPKVVRGRDALGELAQRGEFSREDLFTILAERGQAPDGELPDTGVGLEMERLLSSIFIVSERYGTRSSTVLLIDSDRQVSFVERRFNGGPAQDAEACFTIR